MIKYYGKDNKGFAKARANRTQRAISRRVKNGENCKNSPALCDLYDRAYGRLSHDRNGYETFTRREFYGHKIK